MARKNNERAISWLANIKEMIQLCNSLPALLSHQVFKMSQSSCTVTGGNGNCMWSPRSPQCQLYRAFMSMLIGEYIQGHIYLHASVSHYCKTFSFF